MLMSGAVAEFEGSEDKDVEDLKDLSASQRRQAKNRAAQRRFRDRQKVHCFDPSGVFGLDRLWHSVTARTTQGRSQTLETLLALTTAELQQVKSNQEPLEARNSLLEGLIGAVAAKQQTIPAPAEETSGSAKVIVCMCLKIVLPAAHVHTQQHGSSQPF